MYLKKIEITGFKSFAKKTILTFLPACKNSKNKECGVTAIVGPNGSGKSNVADAMSWVMGLQSAKALRAKKSEDIIFAGSGKRGKLNAASVSLFLDNSDKKLPLEFSEVVIARKIYRSGESEYFINGSKVRLLDVLELLAQAGIGKDSYCVLNQGMSDAVLNATPAQRRMILEDAAGVKQYQIKKERSIKKLQTTVDNLIKAKVLIEEIEPHLRILKRQADKAQRRDVVVQELKVKQIQYYAYVWNEFETEKSEYLNKKDKLNAEVISVQRQLDKFQEEHQQESQKIKKSNRKWELEREREKLQVKLNHFEKELVITEGRIEIEKEKQKELEKKIIESIPVDLNFVQSRLKTIKSDHIKLIERIANVEDLKEIQDLKEFSRAIGQQIHDLYSNVGKREIVVEKTADQGKKDEVLVRLEKLLALQNDITANIDQLKKQIEKINTDIRQEEENYRKVRQYIFALEKNIRDKQYEFNKMRDGLNDLKVNMARIEVREEDLLAGIKRDLSVNVADLKFDGEKINKNQFEQDINRLRVQLEQIGGIDPIVIEEYGETQKRYDFLTKESKDLEEAMASLQKIIKEMNQKINVEFVEAFEKINKEFSNYFRIIFGGGSANLTKTRIKPRKVKSRDEVEEDETEQTEDEQEDEKEAEIGIEIYACPPGKKINNLAMLSGGERSLTSLALLFAIISHNPPPFAVLDEVEAALDEANSRRFGKIIQDLSHDTQFITITHNRETMRQAALLYGVTMGGDGISQLLSVKIDQVGDDGEIKQ